jgi:copper chaperone
MTKQTIAINGMSCNHCVQSVQRALAAVDGLKVEQVGIGEATVSYDPATVSAAQIAQAVEREGYEVVAG